MCSEIKTSQGNIYTAPMESRGGLTDLILVFWFGFRCSSLRCIDHNLVPQRSCSAHPQNVFEIQVQIFLKALPEDG